MLARFTASDFLRLCVLSFNTQFNLDSVHKAYITYNHMVSDVGFGAFVMN